MPSPDPVEPDSEPKEAAVGPELPSSVQPATRPELPKVITTVRALTVVQVVLVMIGGNCSFGIALFAAIAWPIDRFNWHEDPSVAIPWAWAVGFAAISTYAYFTNRWACRGDRRARTTIIVGTAVLVGFTAVAILFLPWDPVFVTVILLAAAPSLIVQAILLRCVYGREGRRWFDSADDARMDGAA